MTNAVDGRSIEPIQRGQTTRATAVPCIYPVDMHMGSPGLIELPDLLEKWFVSGKCVSNAQ